MNKEEILQEIKRLKEENERLKSEIIDFKLPKNYNEMTPTEQQAYHKKQKELKQKALSDMSNYSVVKNNHTKFSRPKSKAVLHKFVRDVGLLGSIPIERDAFRKSIPEKYKEFHREQLETIEELIERYNTTKAIRNDRVEFGVNFENFTKTYFLPHATKLLVDKSNRLFLKKYAGKDDKNANPIAEGFKFQSLTESQQKELIKLRIKLFSDKLNLLLEVAQKKVMSDSETNKKTYLEKNGFFSNQISYRDASKKYTQKSSVINKKAVDMANIKTKKSNINKKTLKEDENRYTDAQHDLIEWNLMREKFDTFVKNYKGNGRQFSVEFQQNFPLLAEKTYAKSNTGGKNIAIRSLNLASSPISVQQREISRTLEEEIVKATARMQYASNFIPATSSHASMFLGKPYSNAKSQTEKELDRARAKEYKKEMKMISMKKDLIGYETIFDGLNNQTKTEFEKYKNKHIKNFNMLSNAKKINELQSFIAEKTEMLDSLVHTNSFLSTRPDLLMRLNGILIDKNDATSKETKEFIAKLSDGDAEYYKSLIQTIKEYRVKVDHEKTSIEKLGVELEDLSRQKFNYENNQKMKKITNDLQSRTIKLKLLTKTLETTEEKRRAFEKNFASIQIEQAINENKTLSYNRSVSVFDKYVFPATDAFGETYNIEEGTIEAKQIQKIINAFIMKFKNQVQNMKLAFENIGETKLSDYFGKLFTLLSDDFGMNIRDIKKTQKYLNTELKTATENENKTLSEEIDNFLQRLKNIESELIKKLKLMNVEIGNVTTKKG